MQYNYPDSNGRYGLYGGRYLSETLFEKLIQIETAFKFHYFSDPFQSRFKSLLKDYAGRETPLYFAENLTKTIGGPDIYIKREDLNHTGAHKITNALGQALLAKAMGFNKVIAETGAGQHGVATATAAALLGLECTVFMGVSDMKRQAPNVSRMRLLGATLMPVSIGLGTLKDATNAAISYWTNNSEDAFYIIGSAIGPHPYPYMVRTFQSVIGRETKVQCQEKTGRLPDALVACIGGGSNAIGLFHPFIDDKSVALYGIEASGHGLATDFHAASLTKGTDGILHGAYMKILQGPEGNIKEAHSISAGLDYPGVGPEHCHLHAIKRVTYESATDSEAVMAFKQLTRLEGIMPALESAHAVAGALRIAKNYTTDQILVIGLSGRGDKDLDHILKEDSQHE